MGGKMNPNVKELAMVVALLLLFSLSFSCSSEPPCTGSRNFTISFYSGGGFTGAETGITVVCGGLATFWEQLPSSARRTTDSLKLGEQQLAKIRDLMTKQEVFSYNHTFTGNFVAHLDVQNETLSNEISYDPSALPSNMPLPVKDLISELRSIHKPSGE